jgi:hypothetical protein
MGARELGGIIGVAVLLAAGLCQADSATRVEPLDGTQSLSAPGGIRPEGGPLATQDARAPTPAVPPSPLSPRTMTPFGEPSPPNQLTPAPVLPFHPNRPLMPSPSAPTPYSGGGHPRR